MRIGDTRRIMSGALVTIVLCAGVGFLPAVAQNVAQEQKREFNVPAQFAATGIPEFARQAGIQILVSEPLVRGKKTAAVTGSHSVDEALTILLKGTGLIATSKDGLTFTVALATPPRMSQATSHFDINAKPLEDALKDFNAQSGLRIVAPALLTTGKSGTAVRGNFTPTAALGQLLTGSGLTFARTADGTFTLQATGADGPEPGSPGESGDAKDLTKNDQLAEVVVTGTNIRGAAPVGSQLIDIDKASIQRSGASTPQQLLAMLPQNFVGGSAGAAEDGLIGAGFNSAINHSNGSGVNLRGLGNTATLVLIDGNRMAPTAQGGFVDISEIPLAAVDHVEVLTDGSSAIYGSDAIGGVVNFVLSKDFDGLEVRGRADAIDGMNGGRGAITWGTKWNSGNAIVSGQYLEHGELSTGERDFSSAAPQPTSITPSRQTSNVVARVTENIAPAVSVYFDGLYTNSHSKFDYSDGYGGTYFASPIHQYGQGSAGVSANLASDWAISANTSYSRDYTVFHGHDMPVGYFGGLDITDDYRLFLINAKADGTLFVVPGGNVRAAVGVDYRQENFTLLIPSNELDSKFARDVDSVFAEVYVPIVSAQNALPLVQSLKFSAAIRFDRYTDFGDTTNPKFGVSWQPISDLRLRASYSTSFRAPTGFEEIVANPQSVVLFTADLPAPSGVGTVPSLIWNGSVTNLKPETARSFTVGGTYTPSWDRTLSLEANYYDVDYRNRIENPPFVQGALQQLSIYGPLVAPLANDAAAQALINSVQSSGGRFLDFANTGGVGLQYLYDIRQRNVAVVDIAGVDLAATQTFEDGPNLFRLSVNTTFMHHYLTSFGAASTDVANTPSNPLRFRGRFEAGWTRGGWSVTAALNHSNAYKNNLVVPSVPVNAYDTLDVNVHYNLDDLVWRGASINAGLLNAFDRNPPALQATNLLYPVGFDQANGDPYGRQIYVEIVKRW